MRRFFDWSLRAETRRLDAGELLAQACERLRELGVPVGRSMLVLRMNHPQIGAGIFRWSASEGLVTRHIGRNNLIEEAYLVSPIRAVHDGAEEIRLRLERGDHGGYPIGEDLIEEGYSDYLAWPLRFSEPDPHFISFCTEAPGGFQDAQLELLAAALGPLSLLLELAMQRTLAETVCTTYIGPRSGIEVLRGDIRRGNLRSLNAVIWFCDLRGFTRLSERLGAEAVVELLNDYLQIVSESVRAHDGEVLKFIGDAALAIFPFAEGAEVHQCPTGIKAADKALAAAREAQGRMEARNAEGAGEPLSIGVALHAGEVAYGNVGAEDRLDFTVIGPAVNLASRLEGLCADLGERVVVSSTVAQACQAELRPLGAHFLKGIAAPAEVYALAL
ncbi:MAG: adenylate/guanylate cyclase domain-containing protein [Alphaproteobacteria bacterium]|nr:adenylate/guanylate cyclase domain-containing protein [Alphaproteobacteria bacterium]